MMRSLAFVVAAFLVAAPVAEATGWEITVDVFEGAIEGFFGSSEFPHLKSCANDTADAYEEIRDAIKDIETKTPSSVEQGLKELGSAFQNLKAALTECKAAEGDIDRFVQTLEAFKSPLSFVYHVGKDLLVNGKDIYSEITQAVSLWKAQSYRDAGVQIGEALEKLVVGGAAPAVVVSLRGALQAPDDSWTLGLQKCEGAADWTLHGLWPPQENCGGPGFDESAISDLESKMETKWLSCPEYGKDNIGFWTHEWTTHGSCSNLQEHAFFAAALSLLGQYGGLCNSSNGDECKLNCDGAQGPCSA